MEPVGGKSVSIDEEDTAENVTIYCWRLPLAGIWLG